jgi:hypothetical protein
MDRALYVCMHVEGQGGRRCVRACTCAYVAGRERDVCYGCCEGEGHASKDWFENHILSSRIQHSRSTLPLIMSKDIHKIVVLPV